MHRTMNLRALGRQLLMARITTVFPVLEQTKDPKLGFHGEGVLFSKGVLRYHASSPVTLIAHEAAHAMLLHPDDRLHWTEEKLPTGGDPKGESDELLVIQVELLRDVLGPGVIRALDELEAEGYFLDDNSYQWWCEASRGPWLPWEAPHWVRTPPLGASSERLS